MRTFQPVSRFLFYGDFHWLQCRLPGLLIYAADRPNRSVWIKRHSLVSKEYLQSQTVSLAFTAFEVCIRNIKQYGKWHSLQGYHLYGVSKNQLN